MNKSLFAALLLILIGFVSCETDIDVNAEYKDIPVVYAVISPSDTVHYIKINKAFLGDANALDLAADANNFNYADGELDITVEEYSENGTKGDTYSTGNGKLIRTVNEIPKDPGIFDSSTNVLYKFVEPVIKRYSTYKLIIINTSLNKEITSETEIVKSIVISTPAVNQKISFWIGDPNPGIGNSNDREITVISKKDIGRVGASLIFNYVEHYTTASGLSPVAKSVEMSLGEVITISSQGEETLVWKLDGETFFGNIENGVVNMNNISFFSHRELANISMVFNVAGTELNTYMLVSAPSNTVNQDKPKYTNIDGGLGIFSSREKILWQSTIDPLTGNVNLSPSTIGKLRSLQNLGFCFGTSPTSGYKCNQLP
ncbi:MAG: DUF4249 family protein [Flavobacteriales bacterium]|nr:DUF4249 family protein [Flavobacteriales bacterium]